MWQCPKALNNLSSNRQWQTQQSTKESVRITCWRLYTIGKQKTRVLSSCISLRPSILFLMQLWPSGFLEKQIYLDQSKTKPLVSLPDAAVSNLLDFEIVIASAPMLRKWRTHIVNYLKRVMRGISHTNHKIVNVNQVWILILAREHAFYLWEIKLKCNQQCTLCVGDHALHATAAEWEKCRSPVWED